MVALLAAAAACRRRRSSSGSLRVRPGGPQSCAVRIERRLYSVELCLNAESDCGCLVSCSLLSECGGGGVALCYSDVSPSRQGGFPRSYCSGSVRLSLDRTTMAVCDGLALLSCGSFPLCDCIRELLQHDRA